jgi:Fic family protein
MSVKGVYSAIVDVGMFGNEATGSLVVIQGTDAQRGPWEHQAFVPDPLPDLMPDLSPSTYLEVANARAALASLDSTARQLPNPTLLRRPTLQREAQSTSALEGTYAPLSDVLTADEDAAPPGSNMREILNYVGMANSAFAWVGDGRPVSVSLLEDLQRRLVTGTPSDGRHSGKIRDIQVVIGRRSDVHPSELPVKAAQFIPSPPGDDLEANVRDLVAWMRADHLGVIDPVVAAAMTHYQFETLHPFHDGNGRIGRLLVVLQLYTQKVLSEPTLTVSPWFEARRTDYYDRLLAVSTAGEWDAFIHFFAMGIRESAALTERQMMALVGVQEELKEALRASSLRADTAHSLVDYAVANPSFTVRGVERDLKISYGRANKLVGQLVDLGILRSANPRSYNRRFLAPRVMQVLLDSQ